MEVRCMNDESEKNLEGSGHFLIPGFVFHYFLLEI
jgi:hypothetical protein